MKFVPQTSAGIEIAGQDLRIAVVRASARRRRVLHTDVLAGFAGLSDEDRLTYLAAYFKKHKLSGLNVHLTLPGSLGVARDLEFPASVGTPEALRSAVALQVENLSPWALDEIYWDCAWELPAKGARSVVAHVGIVPRAVLDPWITLFRSARLALTGVSLSSLTWAHGVTVFWGKPQVTMVVAAESDYVEGALIRDDRIYSIHNPGVESAALASASALHLTRAGRVESVDQVRFVAYGAAASQAGLEPAALPIEGQAVPATGFGAISTALLGSARSAFRLNLIPPALRFQRNYLQVVPTYGLVAALVVLGTFAWLREPYQQSLYAARLDDEGRRLAVEVRPVADQEKRLNRISDRLKALDASLRTRDRNLEALRELSRVLPEGTWLASYACQDNVVTISGFSNSASAIQKLLEDSPVFRDVQFASSITRDVAGKDRFAIRAAIEVAP
jgi:Tfp pilus assembly protein PilN